MTHEAGTQKTQDLNFEIQTIKKCSKIALIVNRKINQRLFNSAGKSLLHLVFNHPSILTLKILQKLYKQVLKDSKNLGPKDLRTQKP